MNTNETPDARDTAGASAGGVLIERDGPVTIVSIDRPARRWSTWDRSGCRG
jgi:hypothetical protein